MQSEYFKKGNPEDFNKILKRQKEGESDPKFAISDALQEYQQQLETSAGYQNQQQLNKAQIRQDIINFVIDYPISNLDAIKGMEFDEAQTLQQTTEKTIAEYEGLNNKGIISDEELIYIKETVGRTNEQLKKVLGLSTKLSLSFRDFKKELKPLKLARRIGLTNIPIIGKRIERAIESEERAERTALGLKRQLRKKEAKGALKTGGGESPIQTPSSEREELAREATSSLFTETPSTGISKEERIEEERESDQQFETSSGLLEKILTENQLTNELLGGKSGKGLGDDSGIGFAEKYLGFKFIKDLFKKPNFLKNVGSVATALTTLTAGGMAVTLTLGGAAGIAIGKLVDFFFGPRKDNENERKTMAANQAAGLYDETNIDVGDAFKDEREAVMLDEYNRYKKELGGMSFENYKSSRAATGIGKYIEGGNREDAFNEESMKNLGKIKMYYENPSKYEIMYPDKSFLERFTSKVFSGSSDDLQNTYSGQSAAMGLTDISLSQKADKITELKTNNIEKITTESGTGSNVIMQKGGDTVNNNTTYEAPQSSIGTTQEDSRFFHNL